MKKKNEKWKKKQWTSKCVSLLLSDFSKYDRRNTSRDVWALFKENEAKWKP